MTESAPNVFLLGAAKSATTSLAHAIGNHPAIFVPRDKEPHYFDNDLVYAKGEHYYESLFADSNGVSIRIDATPAYLACWEKVIPRFSDYGLKTQKFIVVLRNPADRAISHYMHLAREGRSLPEFWEGVSNQWASSHPPERWLNYFGDGMYAKQIEEWLTYSDRINFLFLTYDELTKSPNQTFTKIFTFLNIDDADIPLPRKNEAKQIRSRLLGKLLHRNPLRGVLRRLMPAQLRLKVAKKIKRMNVKSIDHSDKGNLAIYRDRLLKLYESDILKTEAITNLDLRAWREKS